MNIQDPFCLDHNIANNIVDKMREKFQRELRIAAIKTSVWHNDGFMMGGASLVSYHHLALVQIKQKKMAQSCDDFLTQQL